MRYKWIIRESYEIPENFLKTSFNSEIIATLLLNRGIDTVEKAKAYLDPNFYTESRPAEIPDLTRAKDRIIEAIKKEEKITIFGDYDVDGTTSAACLLIGLKEFTSNLDFYIPNRLTEGYGLNIEAIKTLKKKHKTKLLITCDCGITNHKEIEMANELGIDVIVTDHHSLPDVLPPAYAVLNPKLLPSSHKLHWLPGVGVAYKLAEAILEEVNSSQLTVCSPSKTANRQSVTKQDLLDLVALGMIADLAPLIEENRYLVQIGLPKLASTKKVGLQELLRICGLNNWQQSLTADHIGFGIAPRINAVGRLTNGNLAVKLMTTDNLIEAIQIATELDFQNKQRQILCEETLQEAIKMIDKKPKDKCIVLAKEGWHHGVIGIVASRIVENYHLPVILIAIDKEQNIARGSGRSIDGLNIIEGIINCSKHLEKYGGHKAACGLSIKPENIQAFIDDFTNHVNNQLKNSDLEPILKADTELSLHKLDKSLVEKIYSLAPFGLGNPMPVFICTGTTITGVKSIGKKNQHLKLMLRTDTKCFEALIWNCENNYEFNLSNHLDIAYSSKLNQFNGETFIQLELKDWQIVGRGGELDRWGAGEQGQNYIEIYDFRNAAQECLGLANSRNQSIFYFAEVYQKDFLPLKTSSRVNLAQSEILVFLECPPDKKTLIEIVKNISPSVIYLGPNTVNNFNPQTILSRLTGMLKYVISAKNSKISCLELQSALGINKNTLSYALEVLRKINFLSYNQKENDLTITLLTPSRQNFTQLIEYELLVSELKKISAFQNWFLNATTNELSKMFCENNLKMTIKENKKEKALL